jgi:hypothetical protein
MVEMFEVGEEAITLEARLLCEDLDLDFDIIDIVI